MQICNPTSLSISVPKAGALRARRGREGPVNSIATARPCQHVGISRHQPYQRGRSTASLFRYDTGIVEMATPSLHSFGKIIHPHILRRPRRMRIDNREPRFVAKSKRRAHAVSPEVLGSFTRRVFVVDEPVEIDNQDLGGNHSISEVWQA